MVDPAHRRLEILTGATAARSLDDRATALGAMSMTSSFAAGDLAGGIVAGLHTLAEHARQPRTLHSDLARVAADCGRRVVSRADCGAQGTRECRLRPSSSSRRRAGGDSWLAR